MLRIEDVQRFEADGFIIVPDFFSEAEVSVVESYLVANQDTVWTHKDDDPLREPHYRHRPIYDVCTKPALLDCIAGLLGADLVLLYAHILNKGPGGLKVSWHQDGPYWPRVEPKIAVTAWMALDDADAGNGCMRVVPGSHRGHRDLGQQQTDETDLIQQHAIALPPEAVREDLAVDVVMRRGDVSFHDSYLVHGSEPNNSNRRRAALTIRYVPSSTCIKPNPQRRQYLVRGEARDNGNVYFEPPP